jgi:energy-coupling factor transporter ATP-binding protein EcfA2
MATTTSPADLEQRVKDALRKQLLDRQRDMAAGSVPAPTAAATAAAEPEKEPEIVLGPNQVLFTKLTGVSKSALKSRKLRDFAVSVMDKAKTPAQIAAFIPALNPGYNLQVEEAHSMLMAWECGDKVLVTGPTGSGKSTLVSHCCALTNRPFMRINMTGDIESSVLFGMLTVESGATVWKDGPVTEAALYGGVVLLDEWDVTPPEILFGLQWLFEDDGKLFLKEKPGTSEEKFIIPHTDFRLVCAGNTVGQGDDTGRYSGTNVQNTASVDRFQTTIVLDYLDAGHEQKIINDNCPGLAAGVSAKMVSFANLVRTACKQGNINLTMSPRTLINWGRKSVAYADHRRALVLAFCNKLRESDRKVVGEFYTKVFGGTL